MDSFSIIQQFFTQMACQHCQEHFAPESIELIREDQGTYLVSVNCHHCKRQVGVAMVGMDQKKGMPGNALRKARPHPELTEADAQRFQDFAPITDNDVLDAHHFFQNLGRDWQKHLPSQTIETSKASDMEPPAP